MSIDVELLRSFPPDFAWGVATSAYQIEGATNEDGRGESIWDRFCQQPGAIADGTNGSVACDHYHRLESDLDLVAQLGVDVYRFSVAWPRIQPDGRGAWNSRGLAFYDRLVDGMLARGLKPWLTLNHWDLPQALQDQGGWASLDTVDRFVDFAEVVQRRLGDRVEAIATHNEPWVVAVLGHETGIFAPGIRNRRMAAMVAHHLMLSHGLALRRLRELGSRCKLGIVLNLAPAVPASDSPADLACTHLADLHDRRWFADPLLKGEYAPEWLTHLGADAPEIRAGDMDIIATPMDYLGINYYTRNVSSAAGAFDTTQSGLPLTDMRWEIYPQGLTDLLLQMQSEYRLPPVYITENGGAFPDRLVGGKVHDLDRIDYIERHLAALAEAMRQGVRVDGYMVWSLFDNFEWASGLSKRFGLYHVDYSTRQRTPKESAIWYQTWIRQWRENGHKPCHLQRA